jgi:2-dehydro-3-deoxy-D-arabinonate dehydratase
VNNLNLGAIGMVENGRVYDLSAADSRHCASFSGLIALADAREIVDLAATRARMGTSIAFHELNVPPGSAEPHLLAPVTKQEIWAAGVTYVRSREARKEESSGGGSFYDRVYEAERPELFFKGTPSRVVGPHGKIRIRKDSKWNVPEPELALIISPNGRLVGYTIGNDVSSRDIEGENPLYLPQAKVYTGSCALGPTFVLVEDIPDPSKMTLSLFIKRGTAVAFEGTTSISQMKRSFDDLISYLYREQEFHNGTILLTGTGIVPPEDFSLQSGDIVEITIPEIGTLINAVA